MADQVAQEAPLVRVKGLGTNEGTPRARPQLQRQASVAPAAPKKPKVVDLSGATDEEEEAPRLDVKKRHRVFAFTWNNYREEDVTFLKELSCVYLLLGFEVAPTTGTPHIQGMVVFDNARTLRAVIAEFGRGPHIEPAHHPQDLIPYCKKGGDFYESGKMPVSKEQQGQMEKDRWETMLNHAKADTVELLPAKDQIMYARTLDYISTRYQLSNQLTDSEEQNLWFCGPTRTGKSRRARELFPGAYLKMCNKWWDGYKQEKYVLIEDFDKVHEVLCHHVKIWADRYPFLAERKGGALQIRPRVICVTSNYHPSDIWSAATDLEPILARFKVVRFGGDAALQVPGFVKVQEPPAPPSASQESDVERDELAAVAEQGDEEADDEGAAEE